MENTTRSRIIEEALILFAEKGYKGTNLRDLAARLGLSKSALYKHYKSKEAIWNSLLGEMEDYYNQHFGSAEHLPPAPKSCEELLSLTMHLVDLTVHDKKIILSRKLLLTEQFRDKQACKLATAHFLTDTEKIFTIIFAQMIENDLFKKDDPAMLAFSFVAPITTLIHLCDREPDRKREVIERIALFVNHFIKLIE